MEHSQHFWHTIDLKCPFCSHVTCRACREISFSNLACCVCRARVLRRLAELEELQSEIAESVNDPRQV
jgi:hypothetical protein